MSTCRDCETGDYRCQVCLGCLCHQHHFTCLVPLNGDSREHGFVRLRVCRICLRNDRLTVRVEERT